MAYYTKVLQPDEKVTYVGKVHWLIYRHAIFLAILAVVAAATGADLADTARSVLLIVAAVLLGLACLAFLRAWFQRVTTEIVVTDRRIILKRGWISRWTEEMNISKVETVDVNQGIGGRIFGYGSVWIKGVGGSLEPLRRVAAPLALRNAIIVG